MRVTRVSQFLAIHLLSVESTGRSGGTPVGTVIGLLEDLQDEIKAEGKKEASSYDEFACFCKDKTGSKSESIKEEQDTIDERTATIEEKTKQQEEKEEELQDRKEKQEKLTTELEELTKQFEKDKLQYEKTSADLQKALSSLKNAIKALEDSKGAAAFLQAKSVVNDALELASAMELGMPSKNKLSSFLQVDPDDPEYQFHSDDLIALLKKLQKDFQGQSDKLDADWKDTKDAYEAKKKSLEDEMDANKTAMDTLEEDISELKKDIATAKDEKEEAEGILADDSLYLKDLTKKCESVGREYDQRTSMRFEELKVLGEATTIIKDEVEGKDTEVNKRALLISKHTVALKQVSQQNITTARKEDHRTADTVPKPVSFLQAKKFLERVSRVSSAEHGRSRAVALLKSEGKRLHSSALSSLAVHVQGDPFVKVKKLIQNLIERLLKEAKAEATKNGFCETELGKAYKERDTRLSNIKVLVAEIGELKAAKEKLEDDLEQLATDLKQLNADLAEATKLREEERTENSDTVKTAKEGVEAVGKALDILKEFYKKSAKSFVQLEASPIDEDTDGPGFSGSYKGNQEQSKGIIGMLEVIYSDFDRTVRHTTQAEKEAAAEFVVFDRDTKASIGGKETKQALNEQELEATERLHDKKYEDLKDEQGLLDDCLKSVEDLKPVCLDTGMSYAERVEKREEEIEALKSALCILDTDGVEGDCK